MTPQNVVPDSAVRAVGVDAAARMYSLGKTTVRDAIRTRKLRSYRVGRRVLLKISDIETWLDRTTAAAR